MNKKRKAVVLLVLVLLVGLIAGCSTESKLGEEVNIYTARHYDVDAPYTLSLQRRLELK